MSKLDQMCSWLRASGIYCTKVCSTWDSDQDMLLVQFDDCPKSKEKTVASVAKKFGVKITMSDKGALFS